MSSMLLGAAAASVFVMPPTAESLMERARAAYTVEQLPVLVCPESDKDEIVVCGQIDDPDKYRVPSDTDRGVVKDNIPRAPDVSGLPKCEEQSVCVGFGAKPPDPLIIDLEAIPEAPAGSDADLIARGLKAER